jgi:hypothetical protein
VAGEILQAVVEGIAKGLTQSLLFFLILVFFVAALLVIVCFALGFAEIKKGNKALGLIIIASLGMAILGVAFAGPQVLFVYGAFVLLAVFFRAGWFAIHKILKRDSR